MSAPVFGGSQFPTSIDNYATVTALTDDVTADHMNSVTAALKNAQTKVGVDDSAVTTSFDYILKQGRHTSKVAGGAGAISYLFDTLNLIPASGKLFSLKNQGTERFVIDAEGDLIVGEGGSGVVQLGDTDINKRIIANQGGAGAGEIRYNASTDRWELQNNGGSFFAIVISPSGTGLTFQDVYTNGAAVTTGTNNEITVTRGFGSAAGSGALALADANAQTARTGILLSVSDSNVIGAGNPDTARISRSVTGGRTLRLEGAAASDTIVSAGLSTPTTTAILFGDGDLALGASAMFGTEKLRVAGNGASSNIIYLTGAATYNAKITDTCSFYTRGAIGSDGGSVNAGDMAALGKAFMVGANSDIAAGADNTCYVSFANAANLDHFQFLQTGDDTYRLRIQYDGTLGWSQGTTVDDLSAGRGGVGILDLKANTGGTFGRFLSLQGNGAATESGVIFRNLRTSADNSPPFTLRHSVNNTVGFNRIIFQVQDNDGAVSADTKLRLTSEGRLILRDETGNAGGFRVEDGSGTFQFGLEWNNSRAQFGTILGFEVYQLIAPGAVAATAIRTPGGTWSTGQPVLLIDRDASNNPVFRIDGDGLVTVTSHLDSAVGAQLTLYHKDPSADASDAVGIISFQGRNSTPADVEYARWETLISNPTAGSEKGLLQMKVRSGAFLSRIWQLSATHDATDAGIIFINDVGAGSNPAFTLRAGNNFASGQTVFRVQDNNGTSGDLFAIDGIGDVSLPKTGTAASTATQARSARVRMTASTWTGSEALRDFDIFADVDTTTNDVPRLRLDYEGDLMAEFVALSGGTTALDVFRLRSEVANPGSRLEFFTDVAAAASDQVGDLIFAALNASSSKKTWATITPFVVTATAGSEQGRLEFYIQNNNTVARTLSLRTDGSGTSNRGAVFENYLTAGASNIQYEFKLEVNSATLGPVMSLFRSRTNAAVAGDAIGALSFYGVDDQGTPAKTEYARVQGIIADPANTSEDGRLDFSFMTGGTFGRALELVGVSAASEQGIVLRNRRAAGSAPAFDIVAENDFGAGQPILTIRDAGVTGNAVFRVDGDGDVFLPVSASKFGVGVDPTASLSVRSTSTGQGSETNTVTGAVQTTNATAAQLITVTLSDDSTYSFIAYIQCRRSDATDGRSGFFRRAVIFREGAGSATLVGTVDTLGADKTSGTITASVDITVSGNDARVTVTGATTQTIEWSGTLWYQRSNTAA